MAVLTNTVEELERRVSHHDWVRIIRHSENKRIAQAIMTGMQAAKYDVVASIDADCTYDPLQLCAMLDKMDETAAMVTASPYHPKGNVEGVPSWRLRLSIIASGCYSLLLTTRLHTYTSCFRLYRKSWLENVSLKQAGSSGLQRCCGR